MPDLSNATLKRVTHARQRDPREYPWGLAMSPGEARQRSVWLWFATPAELMGFLRDFEPAPHRLKDAALRAFKNTLTVLYDAFEQRDQTLDAGLLLRARGALVGQQVLQWWGRFETLCESDDEVPNWIRSRFRRGQGLSPDAARATLTPEEHDAFIASLQAMGQP